MKNKIKLVIEATKPKRVPGARAPVQEQKHHLAREQAKILVKKAWESPAVKAALIAKRRKFIYKYSGKMALQMRRLMASKKRPKDWKRALNATLLFMDDFAADKNSIQREIAIAVSKPLKAAVKNEIKKMTRPQKVRVRLGEATQVRLSESAAVMTMGGAAMEFVPMAVVVEETLAAIGLAMSAVEGLALTTGAIAAAEITIIAGAVIGTGWLTYKGLEAFAATEIAGAMIRSPAGRGAVGALVGVTGAATMGWMQQRVDPFSRPDTVPVDVPTTPPIGPPPLPPNEWWKLAKEWMKKNLWNCLAGAFLTGLFAPLIAVVGTVAVAQAFRGKFILNADIFGKVLGAVPTNASAWQKLVRILKLPPRMASHAASTLADYIKRPNFASRFGRHYVQARWCGLWASLGIGLSMDMYAGAFRQTDIEKFFKNWWSSITKHKGMLDQLGVLQTLQKLDHNTFTRVEKFVKAHEASLKGEKVAKKGSKSWLDQPLTKTLTGGPYEGAGAYTLWWIEENLKIEIKMIEIITNIALDIGFEMFHEDYKKFIKRQRWEEENKFIMTPYKTTLIAAIENDLRAALKGGKEKYEKKRDEWRAALTVIATKLEAEAGRKLDKSELAMMASLQAWIEKFNKKMEEYEKNIRTKQKSFKKKTGVETVPVEFPRIKDIPGQGKPAPPGADWGQPKGKGQKPPTGGKRRPPATTGATKKPPAAGSSKSAAKPGAGW